MKISKYTTTILKRRIHDKLLNTRQKLPENLILYIKKFWSLIMNNEQLFYLTSPPSAEFDTAQELLRYCNSHAKQKSYAMATKKSTREKYVTIKCDFGGKYKEFRKHPFEKNKDKHYSGSKIVHLRYMAKNVDGKWRFVVKEIITILLLHLRRIQCIDIWMIVGVIVVTVFWEEQTTTPRPVWTLQNYGNPRASPWRASHGRNIWCRSCFFT